VTITINDERQITIPENLRDIAGWQPGCKLVLDADTNGDLILRPEKIATGADPNRFEKALGILPPWPGGTDAYMAFIRGEGE
jgi:AbrB family looped-hinge helix DNA binding protein